MAETIATLLIKLEVVTKGFQQQMKEAQKELKGFAGAMEKHGKKATVLFGGIAAAIGGFAKSSIEAAKEFETAFSVVRSMATGTAADFKKLEQSAFNLSVKTGIAAKDIAKGMGEMARMGFSLDKIQKAMPHVLNATIVSQEKFGTVLKVTEALLSEFNLTADDTERVVDLITATTSKTRTNVFRLGEAFKFAAPVAAQFGVKMEELAAATGLMVNAGVEGGIAGRSLRASLSRLAAPTARAESHLRKFGIVVKDDKGNMLPFVNIIGQLHDKLKGLGNVQKGAIIKDLFGTEAQSGMIALIERFPKFKKLVDELNRSKIQGITAKKAKEMGDTFEGAMKRMEASWTKFKKVIGDDMGEQLKPLVNFLGKLLDKISNMPAPLRKFLTGVTLIIGGFAGLLAAIWPLYKGLKILQSGFKVFKESLKSARIFLLALTGPIGLLVVAIGGLAAAFIAMGGTWEDVEKTIAAGNNRIVNSFNYLKARVKEALYGMSSTSKQTFSQMQSHARAYFDGVLAAAKMATREFRTIVLNAAAQAKDWGYQLGTMLSQGMGKSIPQVRSIAMDTAALMADFFKPGSPPKEGPLSTIDTWMPGIMDMLSKGIEMGIPQLKNVVVDAASVIETGLDPSSSSVVNNTITVNSRQNTLDERGLGRMLERMRILNGGMI